MFTSLLTFVRRSIRQANRAAVRQAKLGVETLESREVPATSYWWTGNAGDGLWNTAGNWGGGTGVPGAGDDVELGFPNQNNGATITVSTGVEIEDLTIRSAFTGTLKLSSTMSVDGTFEMDGGTIDQPNGLMSDLVLAGPSTWNAGTINSTSTLSNVAVGGDTVFTINNNGAAASKLGSSLQISVLGEVVFSMKQNLTVTNGASINNSGDIELKPVNIVGGEYGLAGTSVGNILNDGTINAALNNGETFDSALPIVNNNSDAELNIKSGGLYVSGKGATNNVSVYQSAGLTNIYKGAELTAVNGYTQYGGTLETTGSGTAKLSGGDVKIHGGDIALAQEAGGDFGTLVIAGSLTMDGGTWQCETNGAGMFDQLDIGGSVTLGGGSELWLTTYTGGPAPQPNRQFALIVTAGTISGDFGSEYLDDWSYFTSISGDQKEYYLNTGPNP